MKPNSCFPALPDRNCPCSREPNRGGVLHALSCWGSEGGTGQRGLGAESHWARWEIKPLNTLGLARRWEGYVFLLLPQRPKTRWHGTTEKP